MNLVEQVKKVLGLSVEASRGGLYVPKLEMFVSGVYSTQVDQGPVHYHPNLITYQGMDVLNNIFFSASGNPGQVATWYFCPFSGNVSPTTALTAANFNSTLTELTSYSESTRQAFVEGTSSSGVINNTGNHAVLTASTSCTVWGMGLRSTSTKGDSSGYVFSASKFSSSETLNNSGSTLTVGYTFTLSNPT